MPLPGPGEVCVRVAFAGVNFIDIYFREAFLGSLMHLFPFSFMSILFFREAIRLRLGQFFSCHIFGPRSQVFTSLHSRNRRPAQSSRQRIKQISDVAGAGVVESAGQGAEVWLGRRVAFVHLGCC